MGWSRAKWASERVPSHLRSDMYWGSWQASRMTCTHHTLLLPPGWAWLGFQEARIINIKAVVLQEVGGAAMQKPGAGRVC